MKKTETLDEPKTTIQGILLDYHSRPSERCITSSKTENSWETVTALYWSIVIFLNGRLICGVVPLYNLQVLLVHCSYLYLVQPEINPLLDLGDAESWKRIKRWPEVLEAPGEDGHLYFWWRMCQNYRATPMNFDNGEQTCSRSFSYYVS